MVIGITGRAGSGKTVVQTLIQELTDVVCVDLDKVGHDLLTMEAIQSDLAREYGDHIIKMGQVDRKALGDIVFNDADALSKLNTIMHPTIKDTVLNQIKAHSNDTILVVGALIQEIGLSEVCDTVITIDSEDKNIQEYSPRQYQIMQRQRSRQSYIEEADIVITNTFDDAFSEKIRQLVRNNFRITTTLDKINAREE